jgi:hypothetical protein
MSRYSKEKEKEFIGHIRQIIVRKPDITLFKIQAVLDKNGIKLDKNYINRLTNKIRGERANRYNNAAANVAIAQFEDFVKSMDDELMKVVNNPEDQHVKVKAVKQLIEQYKDILNLQFDMGVFERQIGKVKSDITNVADILKIIHDSKNKQGNDGDADKGNGGV